MAAGRLLPRPRSGNPSPVKTSLTGIKPTSTPHLGNYLGAIRPALQVQEAHRTFYFVPDYHALTTLWEPEKMRQYTYDVAATWLACGLDPDRTLLYRQSDIPEVFELTWVLACLCATGQLERGHAYKDALAKGEAPNAGLFNYPLLMAADVLLFDADEVPIGRDQKQHLELARDLALRFNHHFGEATLVVPEPKLTEAPLVPGTDGEKMSKSRGNTIPLFAPSRELRKVIMGIATSSEPLEAPKDPESATVFQLYRLVAPDEQVQEMADKLRAGGYGWGHAKEDLFAAVEAEVAPKRERYMELREDEDALDHILDRGASRARVIARATMRRVRYATGIDREPPRDMKATIKLKR